MTMSEITMLLYNPGQVKYHEHTPANETGQQPPQLAFKQCFAKLQTI